MTWLKFLAKRIGRYAALVFSRIFMFFRGSKIRLIILTVFTFPGFFRNLYLSITKVNGMLLVKAFTELALSAGSVVNRVLQSVRLLTGKVSAKEVAESTGFLSTYPAPFHQFFLSNTGLFALFLLLSAVTIPWLLLRFTRISIRAVSSTDMAIEHYTGFAIIYFLLILVYSVMEQNGVQYIGTAWKEISTFTDMWIKKNLR